MSDSGHRTIVLALLIAVTALLVWCADVFGFTPSFLASVDQRNIEAPAEEEGFIMPQDRDGTWESAGVYGGIPDSTSMTVWTNVNTNWTVAQINSAIQDCPSNQVVQLTNGTYVLDGRLLMKSGVVLRGSGITNTILMPNHSANGGMIRIGDTFQNMYRAISTQSNLQSGSVVAWTGGYTKGESNLTFSGTNGLAVGNIVILDQLNGDIATTNPVNVFGYEGNQVPGRHSSDAGVTGNRAVWHMARVTAISGTNVTIWPPLAWPSWDGSKSPEAFWIGTGDGSTKWTRKVGIESLTINATNGGDGDGYGVNFYFDTAQDCWLKDVKSKFPPRTSHVLFYGSINCEVRHCIFSESKTYTSSSYGLQPAYSSWLLVEDNVFDKITSPIIGATTSYAFVIGYNYMTNQYYTGGNGFLFAAIQPHSSHNYFWLTEGNYIHSKWGSDFIHGSTGHNTLFRNRIAGYEPTQFNGDGQPLIPAYRTMNAIAVDVTNRSVSSVGNILGTVGVYVNWQTIPNAQTAEPVVYRVGLTNGYAWGDDSLTYDTFYRHMDYHTVSNVMAYNPTNTFTNLPNSLYLASKPSFFGDMTWPPFDPRTVTTNDLGTNNHAFWTNLPAGRYYVNGNWSQ